jgi:hypothetical protein
MTELSSSATHAIHATTDVSAPTLTNQRGQLIMEAVLIIVVLFGITFLVGRYFRSEEVLRQLVTGPWQNLAGMLQNGVWAPAGEGGRVHPNAHGRHLVIEGERVQ